MGLFKKDESKIPEIPKLPEFNALPNSSSLSQISSKEMGLPALPGNFNENVNRDMIKSAVNEDSFENLSDDGPSQIPSSKSEGLPNNAKIPAIPFKQSIGNTAFAKEIRESADVPDSIFVRIDKFKSAKKEIEAIKKGLLEAEAIINKVNEIKSKEDLEVKDINTSLEDIKNKVNDIDSLVFDKV